MTADVLIALVNTIFLASITFELVKIRRQLAKTD